MTEQGLPHSLPAADMPPPSHPGPLLGPLDPDDPDSVQVPIYPHVPADPARQAQLERQRARYAAAVGLTYADPPSTRAPMPGQPAERLVLAWYPRQRLWRVAFYVDGAEQDATLCSSLGSAWRMVRAMRRHHHRLSWWARGSR